MKKLFLAGIIVLATSPLFARNGTVFVQDKIAPKNAAFVGVVDSSQTVVSTFTFNRNLSSADIDVQHALETLDDLIASGGGGASALAIKQNGVSVSSPTSVLNFVSPMLATFVVGTTVQITIDTTTSSGVITNSSVTATYVNKLGPIPAAGSNTNVQFNNSGSLGGDNGFQYDSSVSSITVNGAAGINGTLTVDRPDLGTGLVNRSALSFNPNAGTPRLDITAYNAIGSEASIAFYDSNVNQYATVTTNPLSAHSLSLSLSSGSTSSFSPKTRWGTSLAGKHNFYGANLDPLVEFNPVGNSSFTIPVYLSTITIVRQLLDSTGSAGSSGQFFGSNGTSGPTWQTPAGSGSASASGPSGSVQIASNSVLGSVTGFVYSTTTAVLTIPGVVITSGTTSGMSSIQRGLTVNTSGYNTVGSSSSFIVNGGGVGSVVPRFTVDPINDIVISSAQAKFVSSTTFNGAVIDGAATAGTSGQVFTSRGNGLSPTWQAPAVSQSDLTAYMTQSSSTANNLKLSSATATYLNKQSIYVASATVTSAFSLSGTNNVAAAAPIFALNSSSVTMYGPNIPAASISAGSLGASVLVSSLTAVNTNVGSFTNANITVNAQGQVTAASNGSAGGGSGTPVAVSSNSVIVSSPTTNINFMPPFIVSLQGATTSLVTLNSSSVTLQGVLNDIHNQNQLQQGASFYVWNGTVDGMLTVYGSSGTDGMSTFDRGLTVNVGQYSTSTSSADFKVKGPNADMFSVAPSSGFIVMAATTVINGGWAWKTRTVTTSTTATVDDNFIGVSDTSAPRTITLFSTATCTSTNYKLTVMDQSGGAASNNITLATTGGQKINGSTTKVISTNYQALDAICKSDGWWAW